MNRKNLLITMFFLSLITLSLPGAILAQQPANSTPSETLLAPYIEGAEGGFSHHWAAYLIEPEKDAADQSLYVELNSRRLGPYTNVSRLFETSPDGKHIAFAAEKNKKWYIVLDGEEKWEYDGLGWGTYSWTSDLVGRSFTNQTSALIMQFSPDGSRLAYAVKLGEDRLAIFMNGVAGPTFKSVSTELTFVGDNLTYAAWPETGIVEVYGDKILGPYDETYSTSYSADHNHFMFGATKGKTSFLIVDGKETELPGELGRYQLGPHGEIVYSYATGSNWKVVLNGRELPESYDEVFAVTMSPDGQHVAFWSRKNNKWSLTTDTQRYEGFDGYWLYRLNGSDYAIFWGPDSQNLAYFARKGKESVLALNGNEVNSVKITGLAISVFAGDDGIIVGSVLIQAPSIDRQAFAQCLAVRAETKCDPVSATLVNGKLAYVEANDQGQFLVIGDQKEGPYKSVIEGSTLTSDDGKHYAYVVTTEKGQQVVLDGKLISLAYEAIYRSQFVNNTAFAHIGIKEGKLFDAHYPLSD